jgi:hypothetical protein
MSMATVLRVYVTLPKRRQTTRRGQGRDEIVLPTIELMRHKADVLGGKLNAKGKPIGYDVHGSTWPLDVYLRRDVIEPRHHKAGLRYHRDRLAIYGRCVVGPASTWHEVISEHIGGDVQHVEELTDADRDWREETRSRRLREATQVLMDCGTWWPVRLVVLDGIFVPRCCEVSVRFGLEALARAWRIVND